MMLSKNEIEERIDEGAIRCLVTLEVAGKPKKHVEKSLSTYVSQIENEKHLDVLELEQEEAIELEDDDGYFSAFAEIELLVPQLEGVTQLAFNFTPASIEILEPEDFHIEARDLQNWLNDILSQLHTVALELRGERQKATHLNQSLMRLMQNFVTVLLTSGSKDTETLTRMTGLAVEPLEKLLERLKEDGIVSEEDGTWTLNSPEK